MQWPLVSYIISLAFLCDVVLSQVNHDYLKVAPAFLKPCRIHIAEDPRCIGEAFENIFAKWKDGVPGLKNIGAIDPFKVKKLSLAQTSDNVNVQMKFKNMLTYGMSETKVVNSSVNEKDYTFNFYLKVPKLRIESEYKIKGSILILNLDTNGTINTQLNDLEYTITAKLNLITYDNEYFLNVTSISTDIKKIGGFTIHFTNLFNGNKALEESANGLFNENWMDLFQILRPAFIQTIDAILLDRYRKIFSHVPAKFVIADLP